METLSETNVDLGFFTNFEKVLDNVSTIEIHLNSLNYLIGKPDLDEAINTLYAQNPKCFSILTILIAIRKNQKKKTLNNLGDVEFVQSYLEDIDGIKDFIEETGLAQVFKTKQIKNLVDYVFGVEVGMDTHARKNRGGTYMENAVANILKDNEINFEREVTTTSLPNLSWVGSDVKRFDFVIRTSSCVYLMEANYYSSGGSKLNETARSYTDVSNLIEGHPGYEFVWITDGLGWHKAKNKLEAAYLKIPRVYNLNSLADFIEELKEQQA